MSLVIWIFLGAIAGFAYSMALQRQSTAYVGGAILGALGGLVGGFIFHVIAMRGAAQFNAWSLFAAAVGALLLAAGFQALRRTGHGA